MESTRRAPIVVCLGSGLYDETLFAALVARASVGFVGAGKRCEDILTPMRELSEDELTVYRRSEDVAATCWGCREFTERRANWCSAYRGLHLRRLSRDGQGVLALDVSTSGCWSPTWARAGRPTTPCARPAGATCSPPPESSGWITIGATASWSGGR